MMKLHNGMHHGKFPLNKAVIWIGLTILGAVIVTSGDVIWALIEDSAGMLFEFVEQGLERFFTKVCGLDLRNAQMAAAYLYFCIFLVAGLMLARKAALLTRRARENGFAWWRGHVEKAGEFWQARVIVAERWWNALDWLNKSAVIVGGVVLAIPLAMLLSIGLGMVVVEFF